jgi:hypothetical protein
MRANAPNIHSFKPKILSRNTKLATKSRSRKTFESSGNLADRLKQPLRDATWEKKMQQKSKEDLDKVCTFRPAVTKSKTPKRSPDLPFSKNGSNFNTSKPSKGLVVSKSNDNLIKIKPLDLEKILRN